VTHYVNQLEGQDKADWTAKLSNISQVIDAVISNTKSRALFSDVDLEKYKKLDNAKVLAAAQTITKAVPDVEDNFKVVSSSCATNDLLVTFTVQLKTDPRSFTEMKFTQATSSSGEKQEICERITKMSEKKQFDPNFLGTSSCQIATKFLKFQGQEEDLVEKLQQSIQEALGVTSGGAQEMLHKLNELIQECTATRQEISKLESMLPSSGTAGYATSVEKKVQTLKALVEKNQLPLAKLVSQVDRLRLAASLPQDSALRSESMFQSLGAINAAKGSLSTYGQVTVALAQGPRVTQINLTVEAFDKVAHEVDTAFKLAKDRAVLKDACLTLQAPNVLVVDRSCKSKMKSRSTLASVMQETSAAIKLPEDWLSTLTTVMRSSKSERPNALYYAALVSADKIRATDKKIGQKDKDGFVLVNRRFVDEDAHVTLTLPSGVYKLKPAA
jgi:hypothetical protein